MLQNPQISAKRRKHDNFRIVFQNISVSIPEITIKEIGIFRDESSANKTIFLDEQVTKNDENFNREGFEVCFKILKRESVEREKSEAFVSAMAVAYHLNIKSVMSTCVALMKANLDETNCLMFYNVCKLYGQTLTRNELFHWLLINFFFIKTGTADIIEQNLLLNLLSNESFVITSEFDLYCMLKNWMLQDLASNDQLAAYQTSDKDFLKTPVGENYQKIFSHLRMTSLLAYTDKIESIFNDKIIPIEVLYETLYGMQRRMLNVTELLNDNQINRFRIARKFIKSDEQTFTTDFFSSGIDLKFRFTSRQLSVTPERSKTAKLSHQGHFEARMQFTLFGSLVRDRCRFTTEATEPITIDLLFGIEKVIANWRKIVAFPCTLSGQIQISLKT